MIHTPDTPEQLVSTCSSIPGWRARHACAVLTSSRMPPQCVSHHLHICDDHHLAVRRRMRASLSLLLRPRPSRRSRHASSAGAYAVRSAVLGDLGLGRHHKQQGTMVDRRNRGGKSLCEPLETKPGRGVGAVSTGCVRSVPHRFGVAGPLQLPQQYVKMCQCEKCGFAQGGSKTASCAASCRDKCLKRHWCRQSGCSGPRGGASVQIAL